MSPFQAYMMFTALSRHFKWKSTYDYIKYGGKVKLNPDTFETKKDKYFYFRLSKHDDLLGYCISNMVDRDVTYPTQLFNAEAEHAYTQYKKRQEALGYTFKQDIKKLDRDFDSNFKVTDGQPPLLRMMLRKEICIETFIILNYLLKFYGHWDRKLGDDPVWARTKHKCEKYQPFINFDASKHLAALKAEYCTEAV
jgi:hypothetical protein